MELTINKKNIELNFGIKALQKLDEMFQVEKGDFEFGFGITYLRTYREMENPLVLPLLLQIGSNKPLSDKELDEYFATLSADEFAELYDNVYENFMNQPLVIFHVKRLESK